MQKHLTLKLSALTVCLPLLCQTSVQAQPFQPIQITPSSYTQEIVVPSDWTYKLNAQSVTMTLDNGPALQTDTVSGYPVYYSIDSGDGFFEVGLNRSSANASNNWGMPPRNSIMTNATLKTAANAHVYQLGNWLNTSSNCLLVANDTNGGTYNNLPLTDGPYVGQNYNSVNLTLNNSSPYTALSMLVSAGSGPVVSTMVISYADGTSQTNTVGFPDWFNASATNTSTGGGPSATYAYGCQCRGNPAENHNAFGDSSGVATGSRLWSVDVGLSDTNSPATNLNFAYVSGGRGVLFAVSGGTNPADTAGNTGPLTGPFAPISTSGFNAGCVVANNPANLAGEAPLTATMDNGTNLAGGANTWFEQGWDAAAPTNGFPVHGSILTSGVYTNRTYQMPSSYHQAMCILVDTNHQLAQIGLVDTNQIYTAFSLLTCGASIGGANTMTNYIILQHADGVNESNLFFGYDWFNNNQPVTYNASERVNIGGKSSTSGREVQNLDSGNPKLFESEFQPQDLNSPVTNIILGYVRAPAANATTYVIAVSASTNAIPPQVGTYTPAQNVFASQSATFGITLLFGSLSTYQWQETDGATFTNNLADGTTGTGSTLSGSLTPSLTIANVSATDTGTNTYAYQCVVSNAAGVTVSTSAPLTLRVSTGTNVVQPGDPISDFYVSGGVTNNGEAFASPAGLTLNYAIDGTDEQYLNYGASGVNTSFVGPIGIIIQPSAGDSVVSAVLFIAPVNASVCDPADFALDGSLDNVNWTSIVADTPLSIPNQRNVTQTAAVNVTNQVLQEVDFANAANYNYYRVTFQNIKGGATYNSLQIGEIQLLGGLAPLGPGIFKQPAPANQILQVGGSTTWTVVPSGPQPYTYQWYQVTASGTNAVLNATNASLNLVTTSTNDSGSYFVVVANQYGSTNSVTVAVTVNLPFSPYAQTVLADNPTAFFPLNEGPDNEPNDGVIAYDIAGGHDGFYTNVYLQQPGSPDNHTNDYAAQFGLLPDATITGAPLQDNYVGGINGISFAQPTNKDASMSVEAWVNLAGNTVGGAGIVTMGTGGGGEEFALDTGGTGNAFRFYFRDAGGPSLNCSPNVAPQNATWYHIVGVLYESNNVAYEYLYINGVLASTTTTTFANPPGLLAGNLPMSIGSRTSSATTNYNLQLDGLVDNVAVYGYALTAAQVLNHYEQSGIAPVFIQQPVSIIVAQGQVGQFTSSAIGTAPLTYYWYVNGNSSPLVDGPLSAFVPGSSATISGSSTADLTITGGTYPTDNNELYNETVSNSYGTITSTNVYLTMTAAPVLTSADLPAQTYAVAGFPLTLSAAFSGSVPLYYQWTYNTAPLGGNARISGVATNTLTINPVVLADAGTYQLVVSNTAGTNQTSPTALSVLPFVTFNGMGTGWSLNGNNGGYVANNTLQLTSGAGNENASSFFDSPLYVGAFEASFTYTDVGDTGAGADGICFVLQDDARGAAALGGGGGGLGFTGVTNSVGLEFNIYEGNAFGGVGLSFGVNGAINEVVDTAPVVINSGDPINVNVLYLNGLASVLLQDANDLEEFSTSIPVNIPATVGGNTAYVGFTGADGGAVSTQQISNYQFISLVNLTAQNSAGNLVLTWPGLDVSGAYQLQSNASLSCTNCWQNVTNAVSIVNNQNQVTLPAPAQPTYFRLQLQ